MITPYLVAFAVVFGINLLPAFAPPTWAVLVGLALAMHVRLAVLIPVGAVAATGGRVVLGLVAQHFRGRLSPARAASLASLQRLLVRGRKRSVAGVLLFLASPLPSNQLFIAAGLLALPLRPLAVAFFVGRLITYSLYVRGAMMVRRSIGELWMQELVSPTAIVLQVAMLAGLAALLLVDWTPIVTRWIGAADDAKPAATPHAQ